MKGKSFRQQKKKRGAVLIQELYEKYQEELIHWCSQMTHERSLAEDLVQEAFMRAMLHVDQLEVMGEEQRRAWLYRSVKNLFIDWVRHSKRETLSEFIEESDAKNSMQDGINGTGNSITESGTDNLEWRELLQSLPDMEGVLFCMRYLQGYNSTELGQLFNLPSGTVRAKLSLARKHLREALKPDFGKLGRKSNV